MRSRVAAQTLVSSGFRQVYNLTGGLKAWKKAVAMGDEATGLHLFTGQESPEQALVIGFGLEMGLRDFYTAMQAKVSQAATRKLFAMLADIEILHQERLVAIHRELTGTAMTVAEFAAKVAEPAMEGGLTTDEYLARYNVDVESEVEVLGLALAIEAQALDLYMRAAARSGQGETGRLLHQIADEERSHIGKLSDYLDQHQELS